MPTETTSNYGGDFIETCDLPTIIDLTQAEFTERVLEAIEGLRSETISIMVSGKPMSTTSINKARTITAVKQLTKRK